MADTAVEEKVQDTVPQTSDETKPETTEAEVTTANNQEVIKDESTKKDEEAEQKPTENTEHRTEPRRTDRPDAYSYRKKKGTRANYESLEESNDESAIRKQVEFYFSDSNLPTDAYLLKLTGGRENKPVPLKTIHDFKRMRHFQPFSAVRDAVKSSKVLELSESDEITRKIPLDSKFTGDVNNNATMQYDASIGRSVYVKGFGKEHPTMQLDLENFFLPYGPYNSVRLRRSHEGEFKGSVFVEFSNEDLAKQFLEQDPKPVWKAPEQEKQDGEDTSDKKDDETAGELLIMSKLEYVQSKNEGIKNGTVNPSEPRHDHGEKYNNRGRGRGGRGDRGGFNDRRGRGGGRGRGRGRDSRDRRDRGDRDNNEDWRERRNRDKANAEGEGQRENGDKKRSRDDTEGAGEQTEAKKQKANDE